MACTQMGPVRVGVQRGSGSRALGGEEAKSGHPRGLLCMTPYSGCVERLASHPTGLVRAAGIDHGVQPAGVAGLGVPEGGLAHPSLGRRQVSEPQLPGLSRSYAPASPAVLVEGAAHPIQATRPTEPATCSVPRADAQRRG